MIHIKIVFEYPLDFVHFYVYKFSSLSSQKICHYSYLSTKLFSFSFKKTRNKVTVLKKITALLSYSSYATIQFSSVTPMCLTLCDPMNRSTPGLLVHHQLPESTQTHVHQVGDAIQPSHPLSSPSPPVPNPSQH